METQAEITTPQREIENLLDRVYGSIEGSKRYAFCEALAIAKELCQEHSDHGYIGEKIRHISQEAGLKFFDRMTGKPNRWEAVF